MMEYQLLVHSMEHDKMVQTATTCNPVIALNFKRSMLELRIAHVVWNESCKLQETCKSLEKEVANEFR